MSLREYNRKRKFDKTPEPPGKAEKRRGPLRYVIQLHRASRLHYDFRLEMGGAFRSWAVPRGPSLNPTDQRLAVFVEDHPIAYGSFEGIIPRGNYGAGTVMIWDQGTYEERGSLGEDARIGEKKMLEGLERGHITFVLDGAKLKGEFALIRLKRGDEKTWLLVKKRDEFSTFKITELDDRSAVTGRTMPEIAAQAPGKGEIWLPKRTISAPKLTAAQKAEAKPAITRDAPKKTPIRAEKAAAPKKPPTHPEPEKKPKLSSMPRRVRPMLPRIERADPGFEGWLYCSLEDGVRALAELEGHRAHLYSKSLLPFDRKFPALKEALTQANLRALLDGEIAPDGRSFRAFDLLYADGEDLRALALQERLKRLSRLKLPEAIELCAQHKAPAPGTVLARDPKAPYQSGVHATWIEFKSENAPKGSKPNPRETAADRPPVFTHLDKVYWRKERITKKDLIEYYRSVAPALLPHLKDRAMSLHRFPNGADERGFYQKDFTGYKPGWLATHRLFSESAGKSVDYVVCQNEWTLLYLANLGCIEMNPWFSRIQTIDHPDSLVIDLDPDRQSFAQVVEIALEVHKVLERAGAESFCKTSGATGMHISVPLQARYDFDTARDFSERVCAIVQERFPSMTTLERNPNKRGGRMYLDFMQNRVGQTLASPYSVRPRPGAPVSAPLQWSELTRKLDPSQFTLANMAKRLDRLGDLWEPLLKRKTDLEKCAKKLT